MRREIPLWTLRWCVRPSITVSSTGVAIARSLRGTILARPTPSCADDDDRVRLPPASPSRNSKAEKRINVSAMLASSRSQSSDKFEDGVAHGWPSWLGRGSDALENFRASHSCHAAVWQRVCRDPSRDKGRRADKASRPDRGRSAICRPVPRGLEHDPRAANTPY